MQIKTEEKVGSVELEDSIVIQEVVAEVRLDVEEKGPISVFGEVMTFVKLATWS